MGLTAVEIPPFAWNRIKSLLSEVRLAFAGGRATAASLRLPLAVSELTNYERIILQIPGRVTEHVTPFSQSLRPLPLDAQSTFNAGQYSVITLEEALTLTINRGFCSTKGVEFGKYWTVDKLRGMLQTRIDKAIPTEWGAITHYVEAVLPPGTTIYAGEVATQGGVWVGGSGQLMRCTPRTGQKVVSFKRVFLIWT